MNTFYALDRDLAKRLFSSKTPESLTEFLAELPASAASRYEVGATAVALHGALCGGDDPSAAAAYPLDHAILGGRQLPAAGGVMVVLKRPDVVQHVAAALVEKCLQSPELAPRLKPLVDFYDSARQLGGAAILVLAPA